MSVDELIDELGGTTVVATAVGAEPPLVSNWRSRGSIPSKWWPRLVDLAKEHKVKGVTFERLASLQAPRAVARA